MGNCIPFCGCSRRSETVNKGEKAKKKNQKNDVCTEPSTSPPISDDHGGFFDFSPPTSGSVNNDPDVQTKKSSQSLTASSSFFAKCREHGPALVRVPSRGRKPTKRCVSFIQDDEVSNEGNDDLFPSRCFVPIQIEVQHSDPEEWKYTKYHHRTFGDVYLVQFQGDKANFGSWYDRKGNFIRRGSLYESASGTPNQWGDYVRKVSQCRLKSRQYVAPPWLKALFPTSDYDVRVHRHETLGLVYSVQPKSDPTQASEYYTKDGEKIQQNSNLSNSVPPQSQEQVIESPPSQDGILPGLQLIGLCDSYI